MSLILSSSLLCPSRLCQMLLYKVQDHVVQQTPPKFGVHLPSLIISLTRYPSQTEHIFHNDIRNVTFASTSVVTACFLLVEES